MNHKTTCNECHHEETVYSITLDPSTLGLVCSACSSMDIKVHSDTFIFNQYQRYPMGGQGVTEQSGGAYEDKG